MRRFKRFIKGSEDERQWINDYADEGWQLKRVNDYSYTFTKKTKPKTINTSYSIDENNSNSVQDHEICCEYAFKSLPIQVQYFFTSEKTSHDNKSVKDSDIFGLKIATARRELAIRQQILWGSLGTLIFLGWLVVLTLTQEDDYTNYGVLGTVLSNPVFWILLVVWSIVLTLILKSSGFYKERQLHYQMLTKNYTGSVLDLKFIIISGTDSNLDLSSLKSIGSWRLISKKNNNIQYALRTILSENEIESRIQQKYPGITSIKFVKSIGFLMIP